MGVATGAYGLSYGALGTAAGLSVVQTCALSVLMFSGGSQFALIGVLGGGGPAVSGSASAMLLGARNALYGARLAPVLGLHGVRRAVGAQLVVDESTAVALRYEPEGVPAARLGFWATGLAIFVLWNLSTLIGAVLGNALGDPRDYGLDAAAPAAFLALLAPRLHGRSAWLTAVAGAAVAVAAVPLVPAGVPVLVAALVPVVAVLSSRSRPRHEGRCSMTWAAIVVSSLGCYLLKLSGLSVPARWLEAPLVQRIAALLPIALLAALAAVQTVATGTHLVLDARLAGVAAAIVALLLRAPFLVVVGVAAVVTRRCSCILLRI